MRIRCAAAWLSTVLVACVVALAVPISQLQLVSIIKSCCCPDPENCHCPDHKTDQSSTPSMRACHNSEQVIVSPQAPAFHAPAIEPVAPPARVQVALAPAIAVPHPAPPPIRPDAPS